MCGIIAEFQPGGRARAGHLEMLRHRGPDAQGDWLSRDGSCWLGHARLAILDLSAAGAQPMRHSHAPLCMTFNGEIYNHHQIRSWLTSEMGWRGSSDTETLLAGFSRWGEGVLAKLKGMFAFVIFDEAAGSLFVARDRFGIKPLYYIVEPGRFRFASEVRGLLGNCRPTPSPEQVASFLQWGACPEDSSLGLGVRAFPPGHWMRISANGEMQLRRYWPDCGRFESDPHEAPRRVRELLERAVEEHLLADVSVASFLSGGIDSSVITALAALKSKAPVRTFSVGFARREFDETLIAAEVASRYRTDHERIELDEAETIRWVEEAVERMDLPSVDAINTYIVSRKVAEAGLKVALSGLGGDELFGGYPVFDEIGKLKRLASLAKPMRAGLAMFGNRGQRIAEVPSGSVEEIVLWRRRFWTDAMLRAAGLPAGIQPQVASIGLPDTFAEVSWTELCAYMRHMLLRDSDQMSMAVSLELRVPFLDHELVEYVLGLPAAAKAGPAPVKPLLVDAVRDLLPASVYDRAKQGFALPMDVWMRGPLARFVRAGLEFVREMKLISPEFMDKLDLSFHLKRVHWTRLWSLVVLGHYFRNQPASSSPSPRWDGERLAAGLA